MDEDITKLFKEYGSENATGYCLDYGNRRYSIRDKYISGFWKRYCQIVADRGNKRFLISEVGDSHAPPLSIDGTVKFSKSYDGSEIITNEFIQNIVSAYQDAIEETFQVDEDGMELRCVYLESDEYEHEGFKCASFRIQFPWCRVDPSHHKRTIRPQVVEYLKKNKALEALLEEPESKWEEILNANLIGEPLPLYGSTRHSAIPALTFRCVYGKREEDSEIIDVLSLNDVFNPKKHDHYSRLKVISKHFFEEEEPRFWLPMFLSVFYHPVTTHIIGDQDEIEDDNSSIGEDKDGETDDIDHEFDLINIFVPMISSERKKIPLFFRMIGMAIYNISEGSQRGLQKWIDIGKSSEYSADFLNNCNVKYYKFRHNNYYGIRTLGFLAKLDSLSSYDTWHEKWCFEAMQTACSTMSDWDIAVAFHKQFWLDYICVGMSLKHWYKYSKHRWTRCTDAIAVSKTISKEFVQRFRTTRNKMSSSQVDSKKKISKKEMKEMDDAIDNICKLVSKLKSHNNKQKFIKEFCTQFNCDHFVEAKDMNKRLFAHSNLVIEVDDDNGECIVRDGVPEDYVTINSGNFYNKNITKQSPGYRAWRKWLHQLFPDKPVRRQFKKWLASCMRGENLDKRHIFLTGPRGGGKTSLLQFIARLFGPMYTTWESSVLQKASSSGAASPDMASSKYVKVISMEEFGQKGVTLSGEWLKKMRGNGKVKARDLYIPGSESPSFDFTAKLIMAFNRFPKIRDSDEATRESILVFPTVSIWREDAPADPKEQKRLRIFPVDRFFKNQFDEMIEAALFTMVRSYQKFWKEGLEMVTELKGIAEEYWRETDVFQKFIADELRMIKKEVEGEEILDPKITIHERELYEHFKPWYNDLYEGSDKVTLSDFVVEMKERLGKQIKKGNWAGIQIKEEENKKVKNKKRRVQ